MSGAERGLTFALAASEEGTDGHRPFRIVASSVADPFYVRHNCVAQPGIHVQKQVVWPSIFWTRKKPTHASDVDAISESAGI